MLTLRSHGSIFELGTHEYTLDDFYGLQLDKLEQFVCLKPSGIVILTKVEESSEDGDSGDDGSDDNKDEEDTEGESDSGQAGEKAQRKRQGEERKVTQGRGERQGTGTTLSRRGCNSRHGNTRRGNWEVGKPKSNCPLE